MIAGAACVVGGVFFPPAAAILGTVGTKLLIAGGAAALLGTDAGAIVDGIKGAAAAAKNKP